MLCVWFNLGAEDILVTCGPLRCVTTRGYAVVKLHLFLRGRFVGLTKLNNGCLFTRRIPLTRFIRLDKQKSRAHNPPGQSLAVPANSPGDVAHSILPHLGPSNRQSASAV